MHRNRTIVKITAATLLLMAGSLYAGAQTKPTNDKRLLKQEKKEERRAKINELIRQEEEGALIYEKQNTFGVKLYTDGWGAFFEKGFQKSVNKTNLFSLEIGERKHPKEQRIFSFQNSGGFLFGTPLIFGKENNLFFARLGVGQSYLIGGKGNRNGVAVSAVYKGGLSLGGLKPYYVDVTPSGEPTRSIRWEGGEGEYDNLFVSPGVLGASGVFKGFSEMRIKPGAFLQGALRFDYGRYNEVISAISTGFNIEFFSSEMPIMISSQVEGLQLVEPKRSFFNVFVALEFGRRK